jgi:hypothetical protein
MKWKQSVRMEVYYYYTIFTNKQFYKKLEYNELGNKVLAGYCIGMNSEHTNWLWVVDKVEFTDKGIKYIRRISGDNFIYNTVLLALDGSFTNEWNNMIRGIK